MSGTSETMRVRYDAINPGHFFACCGLLELGDRLWGGAEGWFEGNKFVIHQAGTLSQMLRSLADSELRQVDSQDETASPIEVGGPFGLLLDWWQRESGLKPWAGRMSGIRMARAMQAAIRSPEFHNEAFFDLPTVTFDPEENKKVEPFYFDARRGSAAHPIDIGFSPDTLSMTSVAYPAVELLCLIGLQRFRPRSTRAARVFEYFTWHWPLPVQAAPLAACGLLAHDGWQGYRFENAFRTDQRKHKGFLSASSI